MSESNGLEFDFTLITTDGHFDRADCYMDVCSNVTTFYVHLSMALSDGYQMVGGVQYQRDRKEMETYLYQMLVKAPRGRADTISVKDAAFFVSEAVKY